MKNLNALFSYLLKNEVDNPVSHKAVFHRVTSDFYGK